MMEVYMYSNRSADTYSAHGIYDDGKLIVKKGSKIALELKNNFRPYAIVVELRNNPDIVDKSGFVLKDIEFSSPSGAAQFVSGRSTDGLMAWKIARGVNLRSVIKK